MFSYLPVLPKVGYVCKIYDLAREEGVKSLGKKRKTRLGEKREAKRDGSDEVPPKRDPDPKRRTWEEERTERLTVL